MKNKPLTISQERALAMCQEMLLPFGVTLNFQSLLTKCRDSDLNFHRALIAFILNRKGYSLKKIAGTLNRSNHTSAINWLKYSEKYQGRDPRYGEIVKALKILHFQHDIRNKINYHEEELVKLRKQLEEDDLSKYLKSM